MADGYLECKCGAKLDLVRRDGGLYVDRVWVPGIAQSQKGGMPTGPQDGRRIECPVCHRDLTGVPFMTPEELGAVAQVFVDMWTRPCQENMRVHPGARALLLALAEDRRPGPPPPPPVACPFCGAEHDGRYEDQWDDGDCDGHRVHRCACGALRVDGEWYRREG